MSAQPFDDVVSSSEPVRVALSGEIDCATAPMARARLLAAVRDHPGRECVVNMSEVTFLDCSGIGVLVDAREEARSTGGFLRLAEVGPGPQRILTLVGMDAPDFV